MITACIITRDQQDKLEKCLQHLKMFPLEIVVVDTGSIDDSKMIAQKYTEYVYDFPWTGDFAAAKNFAVEKAPTDVVFCVDTDEYVTELDVDEIEHIFEKNPNDIARIRLHNIFGTLEEQQENEEWLSRIFRKDMCCFEGKIHEQIVPKNGETSSIINTSTKVLHDGYLLTEEEREKKTTRNIDLLKNELECLLSEYEGQDFLQLAPKVQTRASYILYQLGKSYYMKRDYVTAVEYFELGLSFDLNERQEYVIDMVETYGYAMINAGLTKEALLLESVYNQFCGRADFCFLMGLIYMKNERFDDAIVQFEKATTFKTSSIWGVNSFLAYFNAGIICECLGRKEEARNYYTLAGEYEKAQQRLRNL